MTEAYPELPPERICDLVTQWLRSENWKVSDVQAPGALWLLAADDRAGRRIIVGQPEKVRDQIRFQADIDFPEDVANQFASFPHDLRKKILWDLRLELLSMNVEFGGASEPLKRISVTQRIYLDGLSKDTFHQRISLVKSGLLMVIWSLRRHIESLLGGDEAEAELLH